MKKTTLQSPLHLFFALICFCVVNSSFAEDSLKTPLYDSENWYSWVNLMPGTVGSDGLTELRIIGNVLVANPGVNVSLTVGDQGFNPEVLVMNLELVQEPGIFPAVLTWKQATFEQSINMDYQNYTAIQLFHNDEFVAYFTVEEIW